MPWSGATTLERRAALRRAERVAGRRRAWCASPSPTTASSRATRSTRVLHGDLTYIGFRFGHDPAYLRLRGRPVVFVQAGPHDGCAMVRRWHSAGSASVYLVMPAFPGWQSCAKLAEQLVRGAPPASRRTICAGESFSISPGAWTTSEQAPAQPRDLTVFAASVRQMVASHEPWQIVSSFNDWIAGTAIEAGGGWLSGSGFGTYLDALHVDGVGLAPAPADPTDRGSGQHRLRHRRSLPSWTAPARRRSATWRRPRRSCSPSATGVLVLGDAQDDDGSLYNFQHAYARSWGRLLPITHPVPGSKDYRKPGAPGYFGYFGAAAGDPAKGYYSYDIGSWHIVALNAVCAPVGGCEAGSAQEQWLRADLAAHPAICTLAYWYQPRFSSGKTGNHRAYDAFWRDLYRAGADVVLNADDQDYERFAPQDPKAAADPAGGIREFVVGNGRHRAHAVRRHRSRTARCVRTPPSASSSSPCTRRRTTGRSRPSRDRRSRTPARYSCH